MTRFLKTCGMLALTACLATAAHAADKSDSTKSINLKVTGMTCGGCEKAVSKKFNSLDGVSAVKASSKNGAVSVSYDPDKVSYDALVATLKGSKFEAVGQTLELKVSGMTCAGCEGKVNKALAAIPGTTVTKVCHKSGCAEVVFDGKKESHDKIVAAITGVGFKVD